jgi:hypothetical protein
MVFTKLVFDLDLEFFYARFNHPLEVDLTIPKTQHYSNFQMVPPRGKSESSRQEKESRRQKAGGSK